MPGLPLRLMKPIQLSTTRGTGWPELWGQRGCSLLSGHSKSHLITCLLLFSPNNVLWLLAMRPGMRLARFTPRCLMSLVPFEAEPYILLANCLLLPCANGIQFCMLASNQVALQNSN